MVAQLPRHSRSQGAFPGSGRTINAQHGNPLRFSLRQGKKSREKFGKGLSHAHRVFDAHRQTGRIERGQRKTHRHAVVVVSVDAGLFPAGRLPRSQTFRRRDADIVRPLFHASTQLAQFASHGSDAVGFLHAPTGDIAQRRDAIGIQRHHGQRHGRIRHVVAIQVNRLQRPRSALDGDAAGGAVDLRAHLACGVNEPDVALNRIRPHALHRDAVSLRRIGRNGAQSDEITGR